MKKKKIIFICTGNSARSIMSEAIFRQIAGDQFEVYSAGIVPQGVNPFTIKTLNEIEINTEGLCSSHIDEYKDGYMFDYAVTVCSNAEENCPFMPNVKTRLHIPFDDPAGFNGTDNDKLQYFRKIRDEIHEKLFDLLEELK